MRVPRVSSLVLWIVTLVVIGGSAATIVGQGAATAQAYRTVNVRQGPGTQFTIIGQLRSGNVVTVTGRSDADGNWLRINFDNGEGWIAAFTVSVSGSLDALPILELERVSGGSTGTSSGGGGASGGTASAQSVSPFVNRAQLGDTPYVTAFRRINVRIGPGTEFTRLGYMNPGNVADLTGRTDDNEWLQINFNGQSGWVAFFVVSVSGDLARVPVLNVDRQVRTPLPTQSPTPAPLVIIVTTQFNANLRASPDFASATLVIVPFNIDLQAEARTANSNWIRVTYNGSTGWLITSLVRVDANRQTLERLPVAS